MRLATDIVHRQYSLLMMLYAAVRRIACGIVALYADINVYHLKTSSNVAAYIIKINIQVQVYKCY